MLVFTCGTFDVLHYGHVSFLARAKALGDTLVVGVNTDESVRRLKGKNRPLCTLQQRVACLSALRFVNRVVPFKEDDPCELIKLLKPDIVVKGSEYNGENAPEAKLIKEMGGLWIVLPSEPIHVSDLLEKLDTTAKSEKVK